MATAFTKQEEVISKQYASHGKSGGTGAMERSGIMTFVERDVAYLLCKIPEAYLEKHYHGDEVHIRELFR